jgi:hypothetical protein
VVIDCLSKEAVFIPTIETFTALDVADAFITDLFSKHGILHEHIKAIILALSARFTCASWR